MAPKRRHCVSTHDCQEIYSSIPPYPIKKPNETSLRHRTDQFAHLCVWSEQQYSAEQDDPVRGHRTS